MSEEIRQIHKMRQLTSFRFIEDPETGAQRRQQVERYAADDTDRIAAPDGRTYEIAPDKSFYVPLSLAEHLLRLPDWHEGPNPFAPEPAAEEDEKPRAAKPRKPVAA